MVLPKKRKIRYLFWFDFPKFSIAFIACFQKPILIGEFMISHKQTLGQMLTVANEVYSWQGTTYRSAAGKHAEDAAIISGAGSENSGGRWNPVGVRALYTSSDPITAMKEILTSHRRRGIAPQDIMPREFKAISVSVKLLDLTQSKILKDLRVTRKQLLESDWHQCLGPGEIAIPQQIGLAAFQAGIEAILVPSAADPKGTNLVVFPKNLGPGSYVKVYHPPKTDPSG